MSYTGRFAEVPPRRALVEKTVEKTKEEASSASAKEGDEEDMLAQECFSRTMMELRLAPQDQWVRADEVSALLGFDVKGEAECQGRDSVYVRVNTMRELIREKVAHEPGTSLMMRRFVRYTSAMESILANGSLCTGKNSTRTSMLRTYRTPLRVETGAKRQDASQSTDLAESAPSSPAATSTIAAKYQASPIRRQLAVTVEAGLKRKLAEVEAEEEAYSVPGAQGAYSVPGAETSGSKMMRVLGQRVEAHLFREVLNDYIMRKHSDFVIVGTRVSNEVIGGGAQRAFFAWNAAQGKFVIASYSKNHDENAPSAPRKKSWDVPADPDSTNKIIRSVCNIFANMRAFLVPATDAKRPFE